ncbi:hypothetical protein [Nocardiopsis sp. CNT312]|uniref:hypothetical protein n=1 Tax=Nocardiopsis sp. CNT312 TaxID=1137268 RepID=UPI00048C2028|nr:hypothetical protein [Nocardiopsis sp. CNT312]
MHRIIVFAHATAITMALLLGFLVVFAMHQRFDTPPMGSHYVRIEHDSNSVSWVEVSQALEETARENSLSIAAVEIDRDDINGRRTYYATSFDPSHPLHTWLLEGYPGFSAQPLIEVRPWQEWQTEDLRTGFAGMGSPQEAEHVQQALRELGLETAAGRAPAPLPWTDHLLRGETALTAAVTAVLVATSAGAGVLLNARSYAVARLAGHSYPRILGKDLAAIGRWWALLLPCLTACAALALLLYNGLAQYQRLAAVSAWILAALALVALAAHALALGLLHRSPLTTALKGHMPIRGVAAAVYTVRLSALVLAVAAATATVTALERVHAHTVGADDITRVQGAARLYIGGTGDYGALVETDRDLLGPWLRRADAQGRTVLVLQEPLETLLPEGRHSARSAVLVVNETYLEREGVLADVDGRGGVPRVFTPSPSTHTARELAEGATAWVGFRSPDPAPERVPVIGYPPGRTFFTYGTYDPLTANLRPTVEDPVVLAVPNGLLEEEWYAISARSGGLLFLDRRVAEHAVAERGLSFHVTAVESVSTSMATANRQATTELRINAVTLAVAAAVLVMTSTAACLVYARARSQHVFARHISGWSFAATHRLMLSVEAALASVLVGWAAADLAATLHAFADPAGAVFGFDVLGAYRALAVSCSIAAAMAVIVTVVLAHFHRRIVREGAAQA